MSYTHIISVEEHSSVGGLGSILREFLPNSMKIISNCVPETTASKVGSQDYLRKVSGLDADSLYDKVKNVLQS